MTAFLSRPHMRKVYGDAIRKDAGVTKTLKTVVSSNSKLFEAQEVKRVVQEVSACAGEPLTLYGSGSPADLVF